MPVSSSVVSRVIGRGGCNVNAIRETTGAHIDIDTSRQKSTGTCIITIKGPADATRQAHQLISALVKDPECDINDVLPRRKAPMSPRTTTILTPYATVTVTDTNPSTTCTTPSSKSFVHHPIPSVPLIPSVSKSKSSHPHSAPISIPSTRQVLPGVANTTTVNSKNTKALSKSSVTSTASHIPSSAKWGSTVQTTHRKKVSPGKASSNSGTEMMPVSTNAPVSMTKKVSGSTTLVTMTTTVAVTTSSNKTDTRVTPAKRQLFPENISKVSTSVPKQQRAPKGPLSYCSVAMGASSSRVPGDTTDQPVNGPQMSPSVTMVTGSLNVQSQGSPLPAAISNFLSHVGQTLGPSLWQDISHPSNRPQNTTMMTSQELPQEPPPTEPITQPVYITTPGALFTPLNQEPHSTSPPSTTASPVPTSKSSASSSPTISPIGSSLAPGSNVIGSDTGEKPNLRPIGTERACRRATASPLPPMSGIAPLIGGDGVQQHGVWRYSFPSDPSVPSGWSTAPDQGPHVPQSASQMVSGADPSNQSPEGEQLVVAPGDTLQSLLERLSLSSHLSLFQKNEIDLDALLLMSEKDYSDIGLPKGPRVKLLNSTRRMYQGDVSEYHSSAPVVSSQPPTTRPVGRAARWSHQPPDGVITTVVTSSNPSMPYGNKRPPGRDSDPNKQQSWKAWGRTSVN